MTNRNMLSNVVLETIGKLTRYEYKPTSNDVMQMVPVSVILSLLDKGEFNAAEIEFYPWSVLKNGKRVIKRNSFSDKDLCFECDLTIPDMYLIGVKQNRIFAKFKIYSNVVLNEKNKDSLKIFSYLLAESLGNRILSMLGTRIKASKFRISKVFKDFSEISGAKEDALAVYWEDDNIELKLTYDASKEVSDKPGTVAHKIVRIIYHSLKPISAAYCSCYINTFTVEYQEKKQPCKKFILRDKKYPLKEKLYDVLCKGQINVIKTLFNDDEEISSWIVAPVISKSSLVGFWLNVDSGQLRLMRPDGDRELH